MPVWMRLWSICGVFLLLPLVVLWSYRHPPPHFSNKTPVTVLERRALARSLGWQSWRRADSVSWTFGALRTYKDIGKNPSLRPQWRNDLLWLQPGALWFEAGARLSWVRRSPKGPVLLLVERKLRAGSSLHLFSLDHKKHPLRWWIWNSALAVSGMEVELGPWVKLPSGAWVSIERSFLVFRLPILKVKLKQAAKGKLGALWVEPHPKEPMYLPVFANPTGHWLGWLLGAFGAWCVGLFLCVFWWVWWRKQDRVVTVLGPLVHPFQRIHLRRQMMPKPMCDSLILAAEAGVWTTARHTQPTLDQPLSALVDARVSAEVAQWIKRALLPEVIEAFQLEGGELGVREAFVIKYDAASRRTLEMHRDASILTAVVALNPASVYEGGGTYFACLGKTLRLDFAGDVLLHCGKLQHAGRSVVRGERFVLVCFLDARGYDIFAHDEIESWDSATPDDATVMARLLCAKSERKSADES